MKLTREVGYELLFGMFETAVWLFLWVAVVAAVLVPLAAALDPANVAHTMVV